MHEIISRKAARSLGEKFYFTGIPCKRGHIEQRYVSTCSCVECYQIASIAWREANPGRSKANAKALYDADPERIKARDLAKRRRWQEQNAEHYDAYKKKYYADNIDEYKRRHREYYANNKERVLARTRAWGDANPEKRRTFSRKHTANRRHSVADQVKNLSTLEQAEIAVLYEEATLLGPDWHVDHIIPLSQGGDHRPYNMQIVRDSYNKSKNAKLWYTPADLGKHLPAHYAEAAM